MLRLIIATFIIILASCSSTGTQAQIGPQTRQHAVVRDTIHKFRTDTLKITVKETESFRALQKSIDSLIARKETEKAVELLKQQVQYHNNLDQLGFRTLQLAGLLHKTGNSAEALAILEGFAVYKPAINFWIDSANTMYDKIVAAKKSDVVVDLAKLEVINSLTAQIRNMKNTNASPERIANLADSLRSLAPGDSVLLWLEKQLPVQSSDAFCEEQRKIAAEKFAAARKHKTRANALLNEAIEALDKCLEKMPSAEMRKKVLQNKDILEKEKR